MFKDQPITVLKNISTDNVERLNLFGINTVGDLGNNDVANISQKTGISKQQLTKLKRQIQ